MAKRSQPDATSDSTVRDARTGQFVTVRGASALKESGSALRKTIDLTKPIARQASKKKRAAKHPAAH